MLLTVSEAGKPEIRMSVYSARVMAPYLGWGQLLSNWVLIWIEGKWRRKRRKEGEIKEKGWREGEGKWEGGGKGISLFSYKVIKSIKSNYPAKATPPNTITLGVRVTTQTFWRLKYSIPKFAQTLFWMSLWRHPPDEHLLSTGIQWSKWLCIRYVEGLL